MCEYTGYPCDDCERASAKAALAESYAVYVSAYGNCPTTIHASRKTIDALAPVVGAVGCGVKTIHGLRVVVEEDGAKLRVSGDE